MFDSVKIKKYKKDKSFDLIVVLFLFIFGTIITLVTKASPSIYTLLGYGLPSLYLIYKMNKKNVKKVLLVTLTFGFFITFVSPPCFK